MRICENKTGVQYRQVRGGVRDVKSIFVGVQNSNLSPRSSSTWRSVPTIIMHTQGGMAYIYEQPRPVNTERDLLPQVYNTSLDPNQLDLPDLPPPYLPGIVLQFSINFMLTSGILCAVSLIRYKHCRHMYNNVGGFRKPIRICSVIKAI